MKQQKGRGVVVFSLFLFFGCFVFLGTDIYNVLNKVWDRLLGWHLNRGFRGRQEQLVGAGMVSV